MKANRKSWRKAIVAAMAAAIAIIMRWHGSDSALHKAVTGGSGFFSAYNAGFALQQSHKLDEALMAYESAQRADPKSFSAAYNLGTVYAEKGANLEAFTAFKKAVELNPTSPQALYNSGLMAERLGRKAEAREFYEKAVSLDPKQVNAVIQLKALKEHRFNGTIRGGAEH